MDTIRSQSVKLVCLPIRSHGNNVSCPAINVDIEDNNTSLNHFRSIVLACLIDLSFKSPKLVRFEPGKFAKICNTRYICFDVPLTINNDSYASLV